MSDLPQGDVERLAEALCHEYHPTHWDVAYGNRTTGCGACRIHAFKLAPVLAAIRDEVKAEAWDEALAPIWALAELWEGVLNDLKAIDPRWFLNQSVTTLEMALRDLRRALLDGGDQS